MKAKDLKNSILQLAMEGKLVPQNPDDVPAKELLAQIHKEKEQLIRDKKIKRNSKEPIIFRDNGHFYEKVGKKGEAVCIDEEIPFDIPDSWKWVRLGTIIQINPRNKIDDDLNVSFIPMTLIDEGYTNSYSTEVRKWSTVKSGYTHFAENDIGIAKITPCFQNRKSVIFDSLKNRFGAGTTELHILRPFSETLERLYLLWFSKTSYFIDNGVKSFTGTAGQQRIGKKYVENCLFPLPPLDEQKRIVKKIEELIPYVEEYGEAEAKLEELNETFPGKIKASILQEAVQGKLIPQNPEDMPTKDLLEQIKMEKEKLIKNKVIKRNKKEPIIYKKDNHYYEKIGTEVYFIDDELPFEIPETWEWVRLENICPYIQRGKSPKYSEIKKYPIISQKCVQWSGFSFEKARFIDPESITSYKEERFLQDKDLLWNSTGLGTLGRVAIYNNSINNYSLAVADSHVTVLRLFKTFILPEYVYYYLSNPSVQLVIESQAGGSTKQKELNLSTIKSYLIPIPPFEEQKRIVNKIEELFETCKKFNILKEIGK